MRNMGAYTTLKRYCEEAFAELRRGVQRPEDVPKRWGYTVKVTEPGFTAAPTELEDWEGLIRDCGEVLKAMPSYLEAVRVIREEEPFASQLTLVASPERILRELLARVLEEEASLQYRAATLDPIYEAIEDYFYRDTVECVYLAPLRRFRMEPTSIQLDPDLALIRIPDKVREGRWLRAMTGWVGADMDWAVAQAEYALQLRLELKKDLVSDPHVTPDGRPGVVIAREKFADVCSALRVFKSGRLGYQYITMEPASWTPSPGRAGWGPTAKPILGEPYELFEKETEAFRKWWRAFQSASATKRKEMDVPLARFNRGYIEGDARERLVDHMIGFEALLLQSEGELSYRLALRGAAMLGKDAGQRQTIRDELKAAYNQRNSIVHGRRTEDPVPIGKKKKGEKRQTVPFAELVDAVESLLRCAIRECLEDRSKQTRIQMLDELEQSIVRGLRN